MPGTHSSITRKALLAFGLAIAIAVPVCAQFGGPRIPDTLGLRGKKSGKGNRAEWSASLKRSGQPDEVTLRIAVKLAPDFYVYPTTYANGALMKFKINETVGLKAIDEEFSADREPEARLDPDLNKIVEKYHEEVSWTRRFHKEPGFDDAACSISGVVVYQICDLQNCVPGQVFNFDAKLHANVDGGVVTTLDTPDSNARTNAATTAVDYFDQFVGPADSREVGSRWKVVVTPRQVKAGGEVTVSVQAELQPGWHVYPLDLAMSDEGSSLPTLIGLTGLDVLTPADSTIIGPPVTSKPSELESGKIDRFHEGKIVWKRRFKVAESATTDAVELAGKIGWQMCTMKKCLLPAGFEFRATIRIADIEELSTAPVSIGGALASAEVSEAIEELRAVNFGGPAQIAERDLASQAGEYSVPSIARRQAIAAVPDEELEAEGDPEGGLTKMPLSVFLGTAVVFGFAALLTPCVFPMIPITVSFFQKQAEKEHHRPITMATVYCLGIVGAFTILGMVMSILFGATALPELANTVVFNLLLGALLIFFAFNLLGMFEIRMPSWLLTFSASKESKGGFVGVLFMALTFTLTSFTCTFAFAGGLLVMAESGDRLRPILGLLAFSAAFSLPFFFLALFPSFLKKLPKSGGWMNVAKVMMGLLELGAAIKFLGNADQRWNGQPAIFDFHLMIAIWAVISIGAALYLFGVFRLPHDVPTESIGVPRFITAVSLMGFAMYLGAGLFGAEKPQGVIWKNVEAFANSTFDVGSDITGPVVTHGKLKYSLDFERALEFAISENKPLFLDFTGENCTNCRKMEKGPMSNAEVEAKLGKFVRIQLFTDTVPLDDRKEAERLKEFNQALQKGWFGNITLPSYVVIPPSRTVLKNRSMILSSFEGYDPDHAKFARFLDRGWSKWQKVQAQKAVPVVGSR